MTISPTQALAISLGGAIDVPNNVSQVSGAVGSSDYDLYQLNLFEGMTAAFSTAANFDTQLFLFDSEGAGVRANDDVFFSGEDANLNSRIPTFTAPSSGEYFLAVSGYDYDPVSGGGLIFPSEPFDGVYSANTFSPVTGFQDNTDGEGDGSDSGSYQLFIQRSFPIDVYFDAFIPYERVFNPLFVRATPIEAIFPLTPSSYYEFAGDNRGFELNGSYRIRQVFTIDPFAEKPLLVDQNQAGVTTGYPVFDFLFDPVSKPASNEDMTREISVDGNQVDVAVTASVGNPLLFPAFLRPDADYGYNLALNLENDNLKYELQGSHDGFPAYSVYIGEQQIYGYNPATRGGDPFDLFGPGKEVQVDESGMLSIIRAASGGVGATQDFPILPQVEAGRFTFSNVPSGDWFDPPFADGFEYVMTGDSFFTDILDFPDGIDADNQFTVSVGDVDLGNYGPGQRLNFGEVFGSPVPQFTLTGIDPSVDTALGDAFPLRLAFDTPRADFDMIPIIATVQPDPEPDTEPGSDPISVPEPSLILSLMMIGTLGGLVRQRQVASS